MMHSRRTAMVLLFALAFAASSDAQEGPAGRRTDRFAALEALNASYQQKLHDLERQTNGDGLCQYKSK